MNKQTKFRTQVIRNRVLPLVKQGLSFSAAQREVIEKGASIEPVTFAQTSKHESNSSFRMYGI